MTMQIPRWARRDFLGLVDAGPRRGLPSRVRIPAAERDNGSRFLTRLLQRISAPLLGVLLALALSAAAYAAPFAYITNINGNNVSVIDTASNTLTATVPVGFTPMASP